MQPEKVEHINVVNWFAFHFPELEDDFHHFANERRCSVQEGRLLKRMGVKKGVADFFLAIPTNGYAGLWIELKVGKGKLSVEQSEFLARKNERGYIATACWGFEAAIETIKAYLKGFNTNSIKNEPKSLCNSKPIC
jgi:hypothetical protein